MALSFSSPARSSSARRVWLEDQKERTCPLCDGENHQVVSRRMQHKLDLQTVICRNCGLIFTNPLPPEELYNRFYAEAYADFYGGITVGLSAASRAAEPAKATIRLDRIEPHHSFQNTRLMEVGPGLGWFSWWARERGSEVLGVEPSSEFHQMLLEEGLPCLHGTFEELDAAQVGVFDMIVMMHVFEHFYDPNRALQKCRELLRDGGTLVLEVPDIVAPYGSLDRYAFRYVHPSNFSPQTLSAFLEKHGFETLLVEEFRAASYTPQHLFIIARKKETVPESFELPRQSADEVVSILRAYRRNWRLRGALNWRFWRYVNSHPQVKRRFQQGKHLIASGLRR